jgi:MFS family permease
MSVAASERMSTVAAREPLGRVFHVHLTGVGLANLADGIIAAAVPLVAITMTRSPALVSLLSAAVWLPWLLFGIVSGALVDRADRRRVQLIGMGARFGVLAALTVLFLSGRATMPLLIGLVFVYGITEVFIDLAANAIVPSIAPRSALATANGRVLAVQQVCNAFIGVPIGGALLAIGAGWAAGVPAAMAVVFLLVIGLGMRGRYRAGDAGPGSAPGPRRDARVASTPTAPAADESAEDDATARPASAVSPGNIRSEIREGLAVLVRHPVLRPLLIAGGLVNMANTAYFGVFVLWVVGDGSRVGMSAEHYPLLVTVLPVGAVIGSLLSERLLRSVAEVPLMFTCWAVNSSMLVVPLLWPTPLGIGAALFVLGLTNTVGNVISQTIRQRLVPSHLLGRVGGAGRTISFGLMPVGAVLGGLVGSQFGLPAVFLGAMVICFVATAQVAVKVTQRLVDAHDLTH